VDQQIEADIVVVNDLLNEIAEINDYIAKAENVKPFSAVDLRDQRQAKLEQLSKYVDVTFVAMDPDFKKSLGRVDVILNNGADPVVKLVDGSQITAAGQFEYDSEYRQLTWSAAPATAIPSGSLAARLDAATNIVADTRQSIYDLADHLQEEVNTAYQAAGGTGNVLNLATTSAGLINLSYNTDLELKAGATGGNQMALAVAELGTKVYSTSGIPEFICIDAHGFADGDKVYNTNAGLMWVASGIDPVKVGVTDADDYYVVEKVSDTSFYLKDNDTYLDEATATSPITTVTKYEELSAESTVEPKIVPYITEFSFPDDTFADGDQIQFTSLPAETPDSLLDSKLVYTLQETANGTFSILKPDGSALQISEDDIYGVDGLFSPEIQLVSQTLGDTSGLNAKLFGGAFYGDFELADDTAFNSGDQVKLTGVPAGSVFEEDGVYTLSSLTVDPTNGAILADGDPAGIKVFQFNDINGDPISGADQFAVDGSTVITLLASSSTPKSSTIVAEDFDSAGQFWGELIVNNPTSFAVGQAISFTNLPAGSNLSEGDKYTIADLKTDLSGNTLITIVDSNGDSITTGVTDFDATTSIVFEQIIAEGSLVSFTQQNEFEGSFAGNFNSIVTVLAQELNTTNIRLEDQELSEKMALESRDQYSGVSQDEEVTDMMKFQRSFQASARHINIIDTLLDQVVNRLGIG
jgi:flagellar hook-associated protein FlgK